MKSPAWSLLFLAIAPAVYPEDPVDIGTRRELFVDNLLIGSLKRTQLKMHSPQKLRGTPTRPFGHYATALQDGNKLRLYYRGYKVPGMHWRQGWMQAKENEITLYAESQDGGWNWTEPNLGIHDIREIPKGNAILQASEETFTVTHNFTPFIDTRPGVPKDELYKALGGLSYPAANWGGWKNGTRADVDEKYGAPGLRAFASADGLNWRNLREEPAIGIEHGKFDSQNIAFWSEAEGQYVCYFRWIEKGWRSIRRMTSPDFLNWSDPVDMQGREPKEHLYTSGTQPYFRAPHIYIALPTRFQASQGAITDIVFMATRPGSNRYHRHFKEAFIRPGLGQQGWGNHANYITLNAIQTSPTEMKMFMYGGAQYVLRLDGFISVNAGYEQGEFLTKPLKFGGDFLQINYSTAGAGNIRVEIQDTEGQALPGYSLQDCKPIRGDAIAQTVEWEKEGTDVSKLNGKAVRLRFVMNEADLYSLCFPKKL